MERSRRDTLAKKEKNTRKGLTGNVRSQIFAELVKEKDVELKPKKNAILSFWRKREDFNTLYCYRNIRIDSPLLLYPESNGLELKLFLHVG